MSVGQEGTRLPKVLPCDWPLHQETWTGGWASGQWLSVYMPVCNYTCTHYILVWQFILCYDRATPAVWTAWSGMNVESKPFQILKFYFMYNYSVVPRITICFMLLCNVYWWYFSYFSLLASGSDDQHAIIWDPFRYKKLTTMHTGHAANIFSVKVSWFEEEGKLTWTDYYNYTNFAITIIHIQTVLQYVKHVLLMLLFALPQSFFKYF